jgi:hypothetical protein
MLRSPRQCTGYGMMSSSAARPCSEHDPVRRQGPDEGGYARSALFHPAPLPLVHPRPGSYLSAAAGRAGRPRASLPGESPLSHGTDLAARDAVSRIAVRLLLVLSLAACQAGAEAPLALYPASPEGHDALALGRLEREGGCLYIVAAEGGERWLAAFPSPGTTWDEGEQAVRVGERAVRVGTGAAFAGGETRGDAANVRWVEPPDPACDRSVIWWVTGVADPQG